MHKYSTYIHTKKHDPSHTGTRKHTNVSVKTHPIKFVLSLHLQ